MTIEEYKIIYIFYYKSLLFYIYVVYVIFINVEFYNTSPTKN